MSELDYDDQVEEIKKLDTPILRKFQKSLRRQVWRKRQSRAT